MMGSPQRKEKSMVILDSKSLKEIKECFRCPLCKKTRKETVTINCCMHSFCERCIYEKLKDEDPKKCPVCNIELGPKVDTYLRPDIDWRNIIHNIESQVRAHKRSKRGGAGETSSPGNNVTDVPVIDPSTQEVDDGANGDGGATSGNIL